MLILREAWEAIPFIVLMVRQKIPLALFISSPVAIESIPLKGTGEIVKYLSTKFFEIMKNTLLQREIIIKWFHNNVIFLHSRCLIVEIQRSREASYWLPVVSAISR